MNDELAFGPEEIQMVFLHRKAGKDIKLIRKWINAGWVLFALNEDKAYFRKPGSK